MNYQSLGIGEQIVLATISFYLIFSYLPFYSASVIVFASILTYIYYLHYDKSYWKRQNVPGPDANLFFGNHKEMKEGMHIFDMKLKEKYGPTYGTHLFGEPNLASSDLEILRHILVKNFSHFEDRVNFNKVNLKDDYSLNLNALAFKTGDEWRRVRNTITPAFTTGKIKRLVPLFGRCAKDLCDYIEKFVENRQDLPLKEYDFGELKKSNTSAERSPAPSPK